ncbi:MAG: sigma-70 family RNA polymerase sigma factor [Candidatus Poribacteria bacterium]|nr:sigma-70 family RNA polymerase sigma factor [Candidatus Poribacteria bacterium]
MERDDFELIQKVLSGNKAAFSELVQKYQKSVHALAWRKIGDFHIAEEITQDTFLQAHKKLSSLKNPNQFAGWLYVITDRLCKAWFRKKKLRTQSLEATSIETLEKAAYADYVCEQREETAVECRREIVQKLMEKLPESERTVMVLHYLGEMDCAEISKFLGVSPNTVKSRLQRARKRLQNEEHIIQETLGSVPLSPNLTENIMRRIDTIKQTSPSTGKPLLPFAALGASAILVLLLMGASKQLITNFQQPYNVDAQSEPTIEIVDTPVVLNIQSKPELQNRVGNDTVPNKNSNEGLSTGTKSMQNNIAQNVMQWNLPESAKARLGKGRIYEIQYSPDGAILAVTSSIGIWLYDTTTHQEVALLTEHTSAVSNITFSPDGRFFASGSKDGTIILWDRSTGTQKTLNAHIDLTSDLNIAFSPDGKTIASGNDDTIRLWDVITGELISTLTSLTIQFNNFLSFTPDGETIVCGNWNGKISLWNSITGEHKITIHRHTETDSVWRFALSPDGKTYAMGSPDEEHNGTIYLYDLNTGELKSTLTGHFDEEHNGTIYLYDLNTGELKPTLAGHFVDGLFEDVEYMVFSPDGKTFAGSSYYGIIGLWDVHTGAHKLTLSGHTYSIRDIVFSPDGKTFVSGSDDSTIRFWDARTGNLQNIITGHIENVDKVAFNSNGRFFISANLLAIRVWDAGTGEHIKKLEFPSGGDIMGITPAGKIVARQYTSDGKDTTILLWDVHANEHKMLFAGHRWGAIGMELSMALSPDGKTLATANKDNTIRLWDLHTGEHKKTLTGHTDWVETIAFSPDSETLASGSPDSDIRLWNVDTGKTKMILTGHRHTGPVKAVSFSPDGKILASGDEHGIIHLWDIDTGKIKITLVGHTDWVETIAFSSDGKTLASGSRDGDIRLWDTYTGKHKKTLTGHTNHVNSVDFSPDGKTLVSGSDDGSVLIWEIDP